MENDKRPTTAEKILLSGFGGNLVVIGVSLILGKLELNLEANSASAVSNSLIVVHLGLDIIQFAGIIGLGVEGRRGKENILYRHKKLDSNLHE